MLQKKYSFFFCKLFTVLLLIHNLESVLLLVLLLIRSWGEWPSGLRRYIQNWEVPGSNSTKFLAGLWDPTLL